MSSSLNYEELIKKVEELEKQALRREQIEAKTTPFDNELEQRVAERTSDLREIIKLLKSEIKARKQIEQMLKTEKEKFRILTEMSPLGVSLIGSDGRYKYVNPKFVELFGYSIDEIPTGRDWFRKRSPWASS